MAMPVEMIDASGKLLEIRIRGMLKKADYDRIVEIAKEAISREGKVRALTTEGSDRPARWQRWNSVSKPLNSQCGGNRG